MKKIFESPKQFVLIENFSWLIGQLKAFVDPNISYKWQGRKDLKGGQRRIYRYDKHFTAYYQSVKIKKTSTVVPIKFGSVEIECDEWSVDHDDFKDKELKEPFPKPKEPYTVLVTSQESLKNNTAKRYYVSCNCKDFDTTFKEELIKYGYTNGMTVPGTGKKKLGPAVCKHVYAVLMREYEEFLKKETGPDESAEIEMPYEAPYEEEPLAYTPQNTPTINKPKSQTSPVQSQPTQFPPSSVKPRGRVAKTPAEKKVEYEITYEIEIPSPKRKDTPNLI